MKTYSSVIDETVEYYKTNAFGIGEHGLCTYFSETGGMCAVGRCLKDPKKFRNFGAGFKKLITSFTFEIFKDEYKHLQDFHFWNLLQCYHDYLATGKHYAAEKFLLNLKQTYEDK